MGRRVHQPWRHALASSTAPRRMRPLCARGLTAVLLAAAAVAAPASASAEPATKKGKPAVPAPSRKGLAAPAVCKGCLTEPLEYEVAKDTSDGEGGESVEIAPVPEFDLSAENGKSGAQKLTKKRFDALVSGGKPFVIRNAFGKSPAELEAAFSCEALARKFPGGRMRREYDWERNPNDQNDVFLRDLAHWERTKQKGNNWVEVEAQQHGRELGEYPHFAPFELL